MPEVLRITSDVTLDLGSATLSVGAGIGNVAALRVCGGATLTIVGEGTIDATGADDTTVPVAAMEEGAAVVVESGTIVVGTAKESCLFAGNGGKVTVNGGTFINESDEEYAYGGGAPLTVNVSNSAAVTDLVVYGGKFIGRSPALGDDNLGGTFLAEGYGVVAATEGGRTVYEVLSVAENPDAVFAASSANALVALLNGGAQNVMLSEDVTFSEKIAFTEDAAIDLNEKTLTLNSGAMSNGILNGAHLTFKNGTLNATIGDGSPTAKANFIVSGANSSLTLENVDYTANGTAIYVQGDGTDNAATASKIVIKESTINGGAYAVGTNASVKDGDNAYKNVNIEVKKSELSATLGSGILFNVAGTLTVSESTIYGAEQGIFLRAGTAVISDSTLGTSYNKTDEYLTKDWKSGTSGVRAALTLGNRNGTYYADAVCTLKGEIKFNLAEDTKTPPIYVYANEDVDEGINDGKPFTTTLDYTAATGVGSKDIVVGEGSAAVKVIPAQP